MLFCPLLFFPQNLLFQNGPSGLSQTVKNSLGSDLSLEEKATAYITEPLVLFTWVEVFRIIPEFRVLRLTFCSKCLIKQIKQVSLSYF